MTQALSLRAKALHGLAVDESSPRSGLRRRFGSEAPTMQLPRAAAPADPAPSTEPEQVQLPAPERMSQSSRPAGSEETAALINASTTAGTTYRFIAPRRGKPVR